MTDLPVAGRTSYPSIFNDVIGPVMRGPSSSHCAAAVRIGRLARALMNGELTGVLVEFHAGGSLATTHESQGSDMGLFGGLLGWEATDERLPRSAAAMAVADIDVQLRITDFPASHPNTYRLTLRNEAEEHRMTALSVGGGMIRVVEVDGVEVDIRGDYHETLVFLEAEGGEGGGEAGSRSRDDSGLEIGDVPPGEGRSAIRETLVTALEAAGIQAEEIHLHRGPDGGLLQIETGKAVSAETLSLFREHESVRDVRTLPPVFPVLSRKDLEVPFTNAGEMISFCGGQKPSGDGAGQVGGDEDPGHADPGLPPLWQLAARYESARGGISEEEVLARMVAIVRILEGSLQVGLDGTVYEDRILGAQVGPFRAAMEGGALLDLGPADGGLLNRMILYVTAFMEVKSSMGVIVAAPTAGACGALPGACLALAHRLAGLEVGEIYSSDEEREEAAKALLAAGMIGVFIAGGSTFAAEVCGCQAETGAGAGMAAAALIQMAGGGTERALAASSMALQNTLGLVCDPVANRVEVPCLGRNVLGAANALASANMALAGFDPVLPLDEVIRTMDEVGKALPHTLRCTALGGLSVTPTSKRIEKDLQSRSG